MTSMNLNPMRACIQRKPLAHGRAGLAHAWRAGLAAALLVLAGCGGGTGKVEPDPSDEPPPMITAPGTPVGDAVSVTVTPDGGAASAAGINVVARAGSFATNATLALRPMTNPVQEGQAAIEISSSRAWSKPLTVIFPIKADEESPQGLGVAVQLADGSWLDLPAKVDLAAGTMRAILPYDTEPVAVAATVDAHAAARERPQAAGDVIRTIVTYPAFYLKPGGAAVKVGESRAFVAYARKKTSFQCEQADPDVDPAPLCRLAVTRDYPFTHDKDGFDRYWSVDAIPWGNSEVGTLAKSGSSTVTYTAPQRKPKPDTVTVEFHSVNVKTGRTVPPMTATVRITEDPIQTYVGPITFSGDVAQIPSTASGEVTWTLVEHFPGDLSRYEASGSLAVTTTYPTCDTAVATIAVAGTMIVYDPTRNGPGDTYAGKYWFNLHQKDAVIVSVLCGDEPRKAVPQGVSFLATTVCPGDITESTAIHYADIKALATKGTWNCEVANNNQINTTADYAFKAR